MDTEYDGEQITISEMSQGCVITAKDGGFLNAFPQEVVIASTLDALALIYSLSKMLKVQLGDLENKNE